MNFEKLWQEYERLKSLKSERDKAESVLASHSDNEKLCNTLLRMLIGGGGFRDRDLLFLGLKHFLDKSNKKFTSIGWSQYRPYWSDGDTCDFYVESVILVCHDGVQVHRDANRFMDMFNEDWLEEEFSIGDDEGQGGDAGIDRDGVIIENEGLFEL